MDIDAARERFDSLFPDLVQRDEEIITEQDARFQIINRLLTEVLGWDYSEIKTEPSVESGFVDYLISCEGRGRLVVEAKRLSTELVDTRNPKFNWYKVGGTAIKSAQDGIEQAKRYCTDTAVLFSALTNGSQWIGFWALRMDGVPPSEGRAAVFPSLEAIKENFAVFYDLFSREGVMNNLYQVHIHEAEGLQIRTSEQLTAAIPSSNVHLLAKSGLSSDIEAVFRRFFSSISGEDDPEMLAECFVITKESRAADDNLEKITRNLINSIDVVDPSKANRLSEEIKVAIESGRGEFVLIIGNKGAGKSTFIDRFFRLVLEQPLRRRCLLVRVELADSPGEAESIATWLTSRLKNLLEAELFGDRSPTYEELQGVFFQEYDRWRNGERKHLYERDKITFKIEFGKWLAELIEREPGKYVQHLLESAIRQRKLMPCLVFDNTDHFPQRFQEAVFQYAQSLYRSVFSFVICPITDRTIWQLSKSGPFQSYETRAFYLPVPSTKEVLDKRIKFIKRKAGQGEKSGQYFLEKGIRVSISDIDAFSACVEDIFINEEYIGRIIGWLSNHDIRRSLRIAERIITSPTLTITDLVKAYVGGDRSCPRPRQIKQALLRGQYNHFQQEGNDFILNLFTVNSTAISSPLLRLSILRLLMDKASGGGATTESYIEVRDIVNYFEPTGVSAGIVRHHLQALLDRRLIQPYDPTDTIIMDDQLLRITHAGNIHYEFAFERQERTYVIEMALTTPIRDVGLIHTIRDYLRSGRSLMWEDWQKICQEFIRYCLNQDDILMSLPAATAYEGQRLMRMELNATWIKDT